MNDEAPEWDERTLISLTDLMRNGTLVATLATAIEQKGIQGWDRFGRFKTFTKGSEGKDAATYDLVLDVLAAQYRWESNEDNIQAHEQAPLVIFPAPFDFGWNYDEAPDFSAIVAGAARQPVQPKKQAHLAELGKQGADVKHAGTRALKAWAKQQAMTMNGHPRVKARQLAGRIPTHLENASKDPPRLIYDAIK